MAFFTARSIESFDMFSWRAEMIAARNRAFIAGSGWPSLAATVISRASLRNSFDFWASCRPLRCMMFLNWEWPAMRSLFGYSLELRWEARRYRPRYWQNQRFGHNIGILVVRYFYLPVRHLLTLTSRPNAIIPVASA